MVLIVTAIPSEPIAPSASGKTHLVPLDLSTEKPSTLSYGHMISLEGVNMVKLTCNLHYYDAMDVRVTPDLIKSLQMEFSITHPSQAIAELLEIGNLMKLWETAATPDLGIRIGVVGSDQIVQGVTEICTKYRQRGPGGMQKPDATIGSLTGKGDLDLVVYHDYQRTVREHEALERIGERLSEMLSSQKEGGRMLIQLPLTTTTNSGHTIAHLASLYQYCLLIRAGITPAVEHTQYLLLDGYRSPKQIPKELVAFPINQEMICAIQVHNTQLLPHLLEIYQRTLAYLSAGFYTGTNTLKMQVDQDQYNQEWLSTVRGDPEQVLKLAKARSKEIRALLDQRWKQQLQEDLRME